ncbi:MAG: hypothetical protein KKC21_00950 [Nitrospinae bacterium]|nr:hypothetical protein [Nitrospinota bacterium]
MATFRQHIYGDIVNSSVARLREELRGTYTPKKAGRFIDNNITYDIGKVRVDDTDIYVEFSSKIPEELLVKNYTKEEYFKEVESLITKERKPFSIEMEDLVVGAKIMDQKKRDFVRVVYKYVDTDLYSDKDVAKRLKDSSSKLPEYPGVNSPFGRMLLVCLGEAIYDTLAKDVALFIKSNDNVFKKHLSKAKVEKLD